MAEDVKTSHKGHAYINWNSNNIPAPHTKYKKSSDKEIMEVYTLLLLLGNLF